MKKIEGFNYFITEDGIVLNKKGNAICQWVVNTGYYQVKLSRDGKNYFRYVHRLVAETLIPNPEGFPQVNHKDSNKLNNNVENLEWVTNKKNTQEGYDNGCYKFRNRKHKVVVTDKGTGDQQEFDSIRSLSEALDVNRKTVTAILKGSKLTNNYNYTFAYSEQLSTNESSNVV